MKSKFAKYLQRLAVGAMALALGVAALTPLVSAETANQFPATQRGAHENLSFYGAKTKRIYTSTTNPQLLVSGEGFLDGICAFGGTLGEYSLALDSGYAAAGTGPTHDSLSLAIGPAVWTVKDTTSSNGTFGCWYPPYPKKFVNGLVGVQSNSGHATFYDVHCSTGPNPCGF